VEKPVTYSIAESIALRTAVRARKRVMQTGSQQRSETPWGSFRAASEAVRNGRIGSLKEVRIGIGHDKPKGQKPLPEAVPATFDFERWLGPAPEQPYMEARVHSQQQVAARPGWITTEDFGLGMITNWGAHHLDIAHWAMGQETGGPLSIEARAAFMREDVWTVHTDYHVEMQYPGNVRVVLDHTFPNGIRFEGGDGWVFCSRTAEKVTASDPASEAKAPPLQASDPKILLPRTSTETILWPSSRNHYRNWLEAIVARRDPVAPVEHSARSVQACATAWIAMKLGRKLAWDVVKEEFVGDAEANAFRSRKARKPEYDLDLVMKKAGLA
jgi:predicted dehydrogenase